MKSFARGLIILAVLAGISFAIYVGLGSNPRETLPKTTPLPTALTTPTTHYPVPTETGQSDSAATQEGAKTVPPLDQSDSTLEAALTGIFGKKPFDSLFVPKDLIRRLVVTIDNATKSKQPSEEFSPLKPLEQGFLTDGKGDGMSIQPANSRRYAPYANLVRAVDTTRLVSVYTHFYPLFQAAYEDLGTQGYFNDRLIQVIDHLLETPEVKEPIPVVPSGAYHTYKYADDRLEALSFAQKALIRMGNANSQAIKTKLRELRASLVRLALENTK